MDAFYTTKPDFYYSQARAVLLPFVPAIPGTVLDVGCGEGLFGKALKETKGATEVWGVEFYPGALDSARKNLDRVIAAKIEDALDELPGGHFDCVCFNDVLEHLADPYAVLAKMKRVCKPGGRVLASIPNILHFETLYRILTTRDWQYTEYGILDKTHLRFFTKKSMARMFEEAGYRVDRITGINPRYGRKCALLNAVLFNRLEETKYVQMVVEARPTP